MDDPVFNPSAGEVEKGKSLGLSLYPVVESISFWSSKGPCWPALIMPDGALEVTVVRTYVNVLTQCWTTQVTELT